MEQQSTSHRVEIQGFTEYERILLSSIFRLSQLRTHRYVELDTASGDAADCLILDSNLPNYTKILAMRIAARPALIVLVVFDHGAPRDVPCATLNRPIRWAELLLALDNQIREQRNQVDIPSAALEQFNSTANTIETWSIHDWYDHDHIVNFQTAPAVLVIDNDTTAYLAIHAKLAGQQYRVDHARDAEHALDYITMNRYNIVISEVTLPDRDGIELCRLIKKQQDRRHLALVLLTQETSLIQRTRAYLAGCDAYFVKPIAPENLEITMQKFLPNWQMKQAL